MKINISDSELREIWVEVTSESTDSKKLSSRMGLPERFMDEKISEMRETLRIGKLLNTRVLRD